MSRMFYLIGKMDKTTTIENVARFEECIRKYGVDTGDDYGYYLDHNGDVEVRNLIYEQTQSVLRTFWNQRVRVMEIGEQVYDESSNEVVDAPVFQYVKGTCPGISEQLDALTEIWENPPDLSIPMEEDSEDEDEDEEDEEEE